MPRGSIPEGFNANTMIARGGINIPRQQQQQKEEESTGLPVSEEEFQMVQELQAIQAGHDQINLPPSSRGSLEGNDNGDSDGRRGRGRRRR